MNHLIRIYLALMMSALFCYSTTITVSDSLEFQTIRGFGCFNPNGQCVSLTSNVGVSEAREWINSSVGGGGATSWADMKALKSLGCTTVVACPWAPPSQYMTGDSANLRDSVNLANFLLQYVKDFKTNVGYDLYSVSPQNEPRFQEPYASCQYDAAKYEAVVKALGPRLHALGGKTLIDVCQDMLFGWTTNLLKTVCDDTATLKWIDAISVHGYTDGSKPVSGRTEINTWKGLYNYANGLNKLKKKLQLWQTEISGYDTQWEEGGMNTWQGVWVPNAPGGLDLGADILCALKYGHISIWNYWECNNGQVYYQLTDNGVQQASAMFYKFIKPGAVNIQSTQDVVDSMLFDVAFNDKSAKEMVVVLVNLGLDTKTITLKGTAMPAQFTAYRGSATESCVNLGTVNSTSISLPTHSITTLVGEGYSPTSVGIASSLRNSSPAIKRAGEIRMYDINGRECQDMRNRSHGVQIRVMYDQTGSAKTGIVLK